MAKFVFVVFTEPKADREEEYNEWYDRQHLADVLALDGITAASRFELAEMNPPQGQHHRYLALYKMRSTTSRGSRRPSIREAGRTNANHRRSRPSRDRSRLLPGSGQRVSGPDSRVTVPNSGPQPSPRAPCRDCPMVISRRGMASVGPRLARPSAFRGRQIGRQRPPGAGFPFGHSRQPGPRRIAAVDEPVGARGGARITRRPSSHPRPVRGSATRSTRRSRPYRSILRMIYSYPPPLVGGRLRLG